VTQVDFYVLPDDSAEGRLVFACRLADKAAHLRQSVLINTATTTDSARLDDLLWTFAQGSFLPHRVVTAGTDQGRREPVLIGCGVAPEGDEQQVLINLADDVPDFFTRYERVVEIIDGNAERRRQGRERFRLYRERGYTPRDHQM